MCTVRTFIYGSALTSEIKVISWIATSVSWSARIGAKAFLARDQFDAMIDTVSEDPLINRAYTGIRRKVRPISERIPFVTIR